MSRETGQVHDAIDRWESEGLITPDLAAVLRGEVAEATDQDTRRLSRYVLAGTAAVVLLIAAGVFLDWAWPRMGSRVRTGFLAATGAGLQFLGDRLEWRRRWVPASYFMQAAGLALLLVALAYSERVWPDATAGALALGALAMVYLLASSVRAIRRSAFMPAVHLVFLLGYLALFLRRGLGMSGDEIAWALDCVLLAVTAFLVHLLSRDPSGDEHPWALNAFVSAVYAGFVLVCVTALGPLDMGEDAVFALDLWLALVAWLTLWGIHQAPPGLRRDWFGRQLAFAVVAWIPLGFFTALVAMDGPPELAVMMVGGAGVAAFLYADRTGARWVMAASALAFVSALWYWGVERAGALGAVMALGVTAALLFWLSGHWGGPDEEMGTPAAASDL